MCVLGRVTPLNFAFENHYITSAACVGIVETTEEYVRAMREHRSSSHSTS